jgi:two-component system, NtrC family, response regulator HydG
MPGRHRGLTHDASGNALIGRSAPLREMVRRVARVGPTEATVLILGERGTGKELVARALHAASPRHLHPLVAINCAALTPELLANELFGHERGAFTGATERRAGLLASAADGTVFFDEVGDLAPLGQAMLLRVLQEREVRPLGATAAQCVDVRVIAATNRDLEGATGAAFRPDLYDRLSEVTIRVPSLRERAEDIPRLAVHFLARAARRHGRPQPRLSAEALAALTRYAWRGNVRELEKAISRAVILCDGAIVRVRDLELGGDHPGIERFGDEADVPAHPPLTRRQQAILHLASTVGIVRRRDVVEQLHVSRETARLELRALARLGRLRPAGRGHGARYQPGLLEVTTHGSEEGHDDDD